MSAEITSVTSSKTLPTPTTSRESIDLITPVVTLLPGIGTHACTTSSNRIALYVEALHEIQLYDFTSGALEKSFPCHHPVKNIYINNSHLIVHFKHDNSMQIWDCFRGLSVSVPDTWKKVSSIFFLYPYCIHVESEKLENRTLSLIISNSENYDYIQTIQTNAFKIHHLLIDRGILYVCGLSTNPNSQSTQKGMLMAIEGLGKPNYKSYKQTFDYNASLTSDTLKIDQGFVYLPRHGHPVSCVWDSKTYSTVLAKEANGGSFIANIGYTLVTADSKEIAIYNVEEEDDSMYACTGMYVKKELFVKQTDQTKRLGEAKIIELSKNNPLTALHVFKQKHRGVPCKWMAEGYQNGVVHIRNLENCAKIMEFQPLSNMGKVVSCTTYFDSNKVLVQYGSSSEEGCCAIVWDLIQQTPHLYIGCKALKNKEINDEVVIKFLYGSIVLQYGNEIVYYKDAMKSI